MRRHNCRRGTGECFHLLVLQTARDSSWARAFSNWRCSVPLASWLPVVMAASYATVVQAFSDFVCTVHYDLSLLTYMFGHFQMDAPQ